MRQHAGERVRHPRRRRSPPRASLWRPLRPSPQTLPHSQASRHATPPNIAPSGRAGHRHRSFELPHLGCRIYSSSLLPRFTSDPDLHRLPLIYAPVPFSFPILHLFACSFPGGGGRIHGRWILGRWRKTCCPGTRWRSTNNQRPLPWLPTPSTLASLWHVHPIHVHETGEPIRLIHFVGVCVACYSVTRLLLNIVLGVLASYRDIDEFQRGRMKWERRVLALYYTLSSHERINFFSCPKSKFLNFDQIS